MAETSIQWTATQNADGTWTFGYTFNGWIGCEKVSPACKNCYAEVDTYARVSKSRGLPLWGQDAARHVTSDSNWRKPYGWNRKAAATGQRAKVFAHSLSDVFEDRPDLVVPRARLTKMVTETPNLDWLFLTKRIEHADRLWRQAMLLAWDGGGPDVQTWLPNIWLGTTVEDQESANKRIPHLLTIPARVRFLSVEPMLGQIDLGALRCGHLFDAEGAPYYNALRGASWWGNGDHGGNGPAIDWVIIGGESGPKARPFDVDAAADLVRQCRAAGVKVFVKQFGERWARDSGTHHIDSHGGDSSVWPSGDWPREMPQPSKAVGQ